jgi:hypothetical protein
MARPDRHDVDYFPFIAKRGRTLNILQSKYGLEGIGFFTNLLRFLALTPDHHYCIKDDIDKMNFFAEIGIENEQKGIDIIELLVKTGKLDKELWEEHKVIVSESFLESLREAYRLRKNAIITIEKIREKFGNSETNAVYSDRNRVSNVGNPAVCGLLSENNDNNPQSKVKKSKVKKSKLNSGCAGSDSDLSGKPKKPPLRDREPVNDTERVEKTYLQNWDVLYSRNRVETPEPILNWLQVRKLLKTHFEKLKPEQIMQAINNGMKDDFILNGGYSLSTMLSKSVLNRLINGGQSEPSVSKHQQEKPSLE